MMPHGQFGRFGFVFELQSASGQYLLANATIGVDGRTVVLTPLTGGSQDGKGLFAGFRYAWDAFPLCVITNAAGLPAAPTIMGAAEQQGERERVPTTMKAVVAMQEAQDRR